MLCGMVLDNKLQKMNKENSDIINKFLLIGNKFMPELHLWILKLKNILLVVHLLDIKKFISHILKNRLDAACFQHDSAYVKYKDRYK